MGEAKRRAEAIASGAEKACGNCRSWSQVKGTPQGHCRRMPPVVLWTGLMKQGLAGQPAPVFDSFFPIVPAEQFCDEHKPRIGAIDFSNLDLAEHVVEEPPRADA
jgi:hypothetical protein